MSKLQSNSVQDIIKQLPNVSDEQLESYYPNLSTIAKANQFVWIDGIINNNAKTENTLGMVLYNAKGKVVNLASLSDTNKPYLMNCKANGAGVFGDLSLDCAYLVDDMMTALDLSFALQDQGGRWCVLLAFVNIEHIAKAFCKSHRLIVPTYSHQANDLQDKIGNLPNVEIYACTDPVIDCISRANGQDNDIEVIKGLDFPYMGGYFVIKDGKLSYAKLNTETDHTSELFLSNALYVDGQTRNKIGGNWGRLLRFSDLDGVVKTWAMPNALLMGDTKDYLKPLANMGLVINTTAKAKALLAAYIQFHPCHHKILCVDSIGWHGKAYALPHRVFGDNVVLQTPTMEHGYQEQGTLSQWQEHIARPCVNHHRLAFALCVSLTGAVLSPLASDSLGFHFVGASSMGKSLALHLGASVWGGRDFIRTWKATSNGMESVASLHNDGFLALDEIGECEVKHIGNVVYMLGNGMGKTRMNKDITTQASKKWRIAYLSTGETTLDGILKQANQTIKAGQAVRLAHINANAQAGFGIFDSITGFKSGHELAEHLRANAMRYHGTAGMAWLDYLSHHDYLATLKALIDDFSDTYSELSSQAMRVCKHFAIVAGVGELATMAGITNWQAGQAKQAVKVCFDDWLATYGRHGDLELTALIERIVHAVEQHQYGRMINLRHETHGGKSCWTNGKANLLGYIDDKYYLFTNAGMAEVSHPLPTKQAYNMLKNVHLTHANHRSKFKKMINGENGLFYAIKREIMSFLDGET